MRKFWVVKVFLLCMACTLCLYGNCAAEDEKENWVQFYYKSDYDIFYVDTNSIRVREYEGRKYLDVHVRRREKRVEQLILVNRWIEVKNAEWHIVYDITNGKNVVLEAWNKYNNPQKWTNDISTIHSGNEPDDIDDKLLLYVNQNYPSIINEIRIANGNNISTQPARGTTEQPPLSGPNDVAQVISPDEFQDVSGDIAQYGYRKTKPNGIEFHPMGWPDENGFAAVWKIPPDSYGGTHVIRMGEYRREGHGLYPIGFHFDYNPETEKFTVYYSTGSTTRSYLYYVTIIDPEAYIVEVEHLEPMDEEWDRKVENPAYQVASPVVCQASKYCPHPKERYQLKVLPKAYLSRINETDGSINPDYPLFVSEYGISSFMEDGYPNYRGFLGQEYPLYEALIEYYKLYNEGGEVADYPSDAGPLVMFGAS